MRPVIPSDRTKMHASKITDMTLSVVLSKGEISSNSLFMRFTTAKKTFTERELDYFTRLNYTSHHGLGVVLDKPGYPGVGTARYFVDSNDPTTAEWAVTVIDKFQGQGIGITLFFAICVLAEVNGIKRLKAVVNPENHVILNWLTRCNSYEEYQDQSVFHVIAIPIPEDFYRNQELKERIREALAGSGHMDNAAQFATRLELKQFYDDLEEKDSDTEDFTVTCSSYDDDSRSRLFTSNNHLLTEMMDEISVSSRSNSIDDFDFEL
ncbi:cyclic nucleotide-binding protein [Blastocystis sp. subtype 4]|uniref:cyclic nucleotide-binding protein n=1 Tax=Blastocystis sp. subtype 4 TaxID=944170 RepID=UPI0007121E86|nr:cyclic nucleotide-binding protein [Blastocystis sp. subtype 4]KNB44266.1 cyclic nucleotide-binding protein [Blastocystis sp. subtype 4]|eukprot:XP_014527709.1 cyclic nucleotide-binding protein [Blastocystis sp. subtype 4]